MMQPKLEESSQSQAPPSGIFTPFFYQSNQNHIGVFQGHPVMLPQDEAQNAPALSMTNAQTPQLMAVSYLPNYDPMFNCMQVCCFPAQPTQEVPGSWGPGSMNNTEFQNVPPRSNRDEDKAQVPALPGSASVLTNPHQQSPTAAFPKVETGAEAHGSQKPRDAVQKRQLRLLKNREAARECRRKKKEYVRCLENRVAVLEQQNTTLIEELRALKNIYRHKMELSQPPAQVKN